MGVLRPFDWLRGVQAQQPKSPALIGSTNINKALKGFHLTTMGVAHRKKQTNINKALKGRNI